MAEFHAMLAMYMNSTSMGYGSPRQALPITMCISPCADRGASHENALSIRMAVPSSSTSRSSGPWGKPKCGPGSGRLGLTSPGRPVGRGSESNPFG